MLPFLLFSVLFFSLSNGALEDDSDMKDLFKRLQDMEAKLEVMDPEIEERLAKLEDLAKIGTLAIAPKTHE